MCNVSSSLNRHLYFLLSIGLILIALLGCEEDRQSVSSEPMIAIESFDYNAGYCSEGDVVKKEFEFVNEGYGSLSVEIKKSSCACLAVELNKKILLPKEKGIVAVYLNTKGKIGPVSASTLLQTNDKYNSKIILTVHAKVRGVSVAPEVLDYGNVVSGKIKMKKEVAITSFGLDDFLIRDIKASDKNIMISRNGSFNGKDSIWKYLVELDSDICETGKFESNIEFYTNNLNYPVVDLPLKAVFKGSVSIMPSQINFGVIKKNDCVTRSCKIQSNDNSKFSIENIIGHNSQLSYKINPDLSCYSSEFNILFELTPSLIEGFKKGELKVLVKKGKKDITYKIPYVIIVN